MKKLFTIPPAATSIDIALLLLRVGVSIFMIGHGYGKMKGFDQMQTQFVEFMGLSKTLSLSLTIFAEFFCSIVLIAGLLTRLALIPLIITMTVALGVGHDWDAFGKGGAATIYLIIYLSLIISGPGRYSLDGLIFRPETK